MSCKWAGSDRPRVLVGRHDFDNHGPTDLDCPGCVACTEPHCRVCGVTHAKGVCAECMAETREALHGIARKSGALPEEVEHRGIAGEAMMLLGPVADIEARQHVEASYLAGRLPEGWIVAAHGKKCPHVGCFECGGDLERRIGKDGFEDHWTCRRCRRRYTYAEYNCALRASLEAHNERETA